MKFGRALFHATWLATLMVGATACSPATGDDPLADAGPGFQCENRPNGDDVLECRRNIDCGGGSVCVKAEDGDEFGCCEKIFCTVNADCDDTEICDVRRGICVPEDLCDPGVGCENGDLCVYSGGAPQCLDTAPAADSCAFSATKIYTTSDKPIEVMATAYAADGTLTPHATFDYEVGGLTGASADGNSVGASCTSDAPCTGTVTATTNGGATCSADFVVYPAVDAADFRVTLFDQTTRSPLSGVRIAARVGTELQEATTDANGSAVFAGQATAVTAVSAFPTGHQWQTLLSPSTNDVALFTVEVPDDSKVAGVKGQFNFDSVSTTGDIKLGLAGTSISSTVTDLDFATLVGEIAEYNIVLEGVTDADGEIVPLPSGLVLELGPEKIKGDFVTLGQTGKNTLWALGGKVRLSEIGPIISTVTASDEVNVGSVLTAVLPFFARFDHAVVSGLDLSNIDRPAAPAENAPVPYDQWNLPELSGADAVKLNTLISQSAEYTVPTLPCKPGAVDGDGCSDNGYSSGAVLLSGVIVPGQGMVPLGLTAGLDDPDDQDANDQVDGELDYKGENQPTKGKAMIDFAPPHDGLEGNLYVTIAIGLDIDSLTSGSLAASIITHVTDKYSETGNAFPNAFLEQQGGTYTKSDAGNSFAINAVGSADFYRINLDGGSVAEWNIWFSSADAASALNLNDLRPSDLNGRDDSLDIQAFKFGTGYTGAKPADFSELSSFNGTNLDNLLYYMGAWSNLTCESPSDDNATPFCVEQDQ